MQEQIQLHTSDFDFDLPPELIAQYPEQKRDASRLLHLHRDTKSWEHRHFSDLPDLLRPSDLLILNNTQVIPARLKALNQSGKEFEILLLEPSDTNLAFSALHSSRWNALIRPGKIAARGIPLRLVDRSDNQSDIQAQVVGKLQKEGVYQVLFTNTETNEEIDIKEKLNQLGSVPLPPYIERLAEESDTDRYQTVYAQMPGSVAAPTAGLHFTPELLEKVKAKGIEIQYVTLHVGPGTFAPVKTENFQEHPMHEERYQISEQTANAIRNAKSSGRRVIPVGTTSLRVLESAAKETDGNIHAMTSATRLFVYPPAQFRLVDAMITNFHFPKSTLVMLVSAFASPGSISGKDLILSAYKDAIKNRYRFFSYGDAMFIE